eukprot:8565201-Alexandrium_andersonii.AAC.1
MDAGVVGSDGVGLCDGRGGRSYCSGHCSSLEWSQAVATGPAVKFEVLPVGAASAAGAWCDGGRGVALTWLNEWRRHCQ